MEEERIIAEIEDMIQECNEIDAEFNEKPDSALAHGFELAKKYNLY